MKTMPEAVLDIALALMFLNVIIFVVSMIWARVYWKVAQARIQADLKKAGVAGTGA
jgi:hypothetical protein